jgi:hypothetical protein
MKVTPDDEVYRVNTVWLGPTGFSFPWTARYIAYATWLALFLLILLIEAVTPISVQLPPIREICIATFGSYVLLSFVDHERPVAALWQMARAELTAPRPAHAKTVLIRDRSRVIRRYADSIVIFRSAK